MGDCMNNRHAYLIMAHGNVNILKLQLEMLDDVRNDIYIHIDKKVKKFPFYKYKNICKYASIEFLNNRINVKWGTASQVHTELLLFKTATKRNHIYYHLLSGVDLPLKNQKEIHDFFRDKKNEYLVCYEQKMLNQWDYQRLSRYHYPSWWNERIVARLNNLQNTLKIDRIKKYNWVFTREYNWCSLTEDAVLYLLEKERFIKKICKYSVCADEVYKQYILVNSPFRDRIYVDVNGKTDDLRLVDWNRRVKDSPHIFTIDDKSMISNSKAFFARKFDENTDMRIVKYIYKKVMDGVD